MVVGGGTMYNGDGHDHDDNLLFTGGHFHRDCNIKSRWSSRNLGHRTAEIIAENIGAIATRRWCAFILCEEIQNVFLFIRMLGCERSIVGDRRQSNECGGIAFLTLHTRHRGRGGVVVHRVTAIEDGVDELVVQITLTGDHDHRIAIATGCEEMQLRSIELSMLQIIGRIGPQCLFVAREE